MKEQIAVQNLLRETLALIQKNNPRYSMRAYAQKVGVHVGALSNILSGKRNVSRSLAERIAERLMLDPQKRSELLRLYPEKRPYSKDANKTDTVDPRYLELTNAQFKISAEWEHFAVMSLLNCKDFQNDNAWIGQRLGITETRARETVERLIDLGLFSKNESGELTRSKQSYRTPDDVASVTMKRHHDQSLDLAKESLHRDPVTKRDFTTLTMAIDVSKISAAKELVREFQDKVSDLLETGNQTEVYRLSVQLFPMTKLEEKN